MTRSLAAVACLALALVGGFAHFSSAAFTSTTSVPANAVQVDQISNHFSVTPGSAVQAGTSTPIASGNVDSLSLAFGTVPSARTFTSVFTMRMVMRKRFRQVGCLPDDRVFFFSRPFATHVCRTRR